MGSQEVQARKTVERVDVFRVEFDASANKVSEGEQSVDTNVFTLKMSETAPHTEWGFFQFHHQEWVERLVVLWLMYIIQIKSCFGGPQHDVEGGMGREVGWYAEDTKPQFETSLYIPKGTRVDAGEYVFTAKAEVFAN